MNNLNLSSQDRSFSIQNNSFSQAGTPREQDLQKEVPLKQTNYESTPKKSAFKKSSLDFLNRDPIFQRERNNSELSFLGKKIKQNKIEELMVTYHSSQDGDSTDNMLQKLNKKDYKDLKIFTVFNQIRDLNDKDQILSAIKMLDNMEERSMLIDKILKRKQEIQDADQIYQMSKVQPLINRFLRKMKKATQNFDEIENQLLVDKNKEGGSKVSINLEVSNNNSPKIKSTTSIAQNGSLKLIQDNTIGSEKLNHIKNQQASKSTDLKKREPTLNNKAIFLSMLQKKVDEPQNKQKLTQIIAYKEQFHKISKASNKQINLNQVSQNSIDLINQGKELAKQKINELLKDVQKQSLAARFKSAQLKNRLNPSQSNDLQYINSFYSEKIDEQMQKEKLKVQNYIQYKNSIEASKVVESDVVRYIDQYKQDPGIFLINSKIISQPYIRQIENQIHKTCFETDQKKQQLFDLKNKYQKIGYQSFYDKTKYKFGQKSKQQRRSWDSNNNTNKSFDCDNYQISSPKRQDKIQSPKQNQNLKKRQEYILSRKQASSLNITKGFQQQIPTDYINEDTNQRQQYNLTRKKASFPNITKGFQSMSDANSYKASSTPQSPGSLFNGQTMTERDHLIISPRFNLGKQSFIEQGSQTSRSTKIRSPEQNYIQQRKRITCYNDNKFKYQNEIDYMLDQKQQKEMFGLEEDDKEKRIQKHKEMYFQRKMLQQKIRNVKVVDSWKLEGSLHYNGNQNPPNLIDDVKDDDTLVSFTEIKLDKLYRKTLNIQTQQRFLERLQDYNSSILKRFQKEIYLKSTEKHFNSLKKYQNEILQATNIKLKQGAKNSLHII